MPVVSSKRESRLSWDLFLIVGFPTAIVVFFFLLPYLSLVEGNKGTDRRKVLCHQVAMAILSYQVEYGAFPLPRGQSQDIIYGEDISSRDLVVTLYGLRDPGTGLDASSSIPNEKRVTFISLRPYDLSEGQLAAGNPSQAGDRSHLIRVALDGDGDGKLRVPDISKRSGFKEVEAEYAVWSQMGQPNDQRAWYLAGPIDF